MHLQMQPESEMPTIIWAHDFDAAVKYATRILHLGAHRQLFYGSTEDYLKSDAGKIFRERTDDYDG